MRRGGGNAASPDAGVSRPGARALPRLATLLALICVSCITKPPGVTFAIPGDGDGAPIDRVLWLERVEIADASVPERELTEVALTYNLVRYLRQQKRFRRVRVTPPGNVRPGDWVAHLRIDRMSEGAGAPGGAVALSLATLGVYAYFGRPLEARLDLAAELELRDGSGSSLARESATSSKSRRYRSRDFRRLGRYLVDQRTRLIDALVTAALDAQDKAKAPQPDAPEPDEPEEPDEEERGSEGDPAPVPGSEEDGAP